jgi:hypothetical protein
MTPNYNLLLASAWGGWPDYFGPSIIGSSGIVLGTNPPYSLADFFAFYPKFGGPPVTVPAHLVAGSPIILLPDGSPPINTYDPPLNLGQLILGYGITFRSVVVSLDGPLQFTISEDATYDGDVQLYFYPNPLLPVGVIMVYIALASASLVYTRWQEAWPVAMSLYIAHFCTLWLRSDGQQACMAGSAAASGLAQGITVSRTAGPVTKGSQPVPGLEAWGSWNETSYGQQFISWAKVVGSGPMLIW